ncbi:brain protein I3 [Hippoglossus stenolepis]|uniref:brain protein I3 n=1 Tax=Hippoglossus stenolepis TaxID=195615 RepID=UPI00159CB1EE|nr:brain protein I3 [Hippoglossus stenolepis]XP_035036218.1 brain protein I3 [Hippoglossus stenolepis]XP_035036219.1 brain protein I3 [Hippoglossus stenolepis]XP_035036220.1 brain protein I3 [Hippoglossus stenolepis]
MVDNKPLLQDRPPAYVASPAAFNYGQQQHSYGAIPQPAPPPYPYPDVQGYPSAQMAPAVSQQPYTGTYTIIQPSVVVVGGCPACRVGVLEDDFTCLGIMCAIFFFPLGILFCFALRQRRCPNCGTTFG